MREEWDGDERCRWIIKRKVSGNECKENRIMVRQESQVRKRNFGNLNGKEDEDYKENTQNFNF